MSNTRRDCRAGSKGGVAAVQLGKNGVQHVIGHVRTPMVSRLLSIASMSVHLAHLGCRWAWWRKGSRLSHAPGIETGR